MKMIQINSTLYVTITEHHLTGVVISLGKATTGN